RSLSTCPRTSTIAGLSPSSSAPSVTRALPLRSGLGAALRDRPRELADQPRIALLDDLEAVVGGPDRILAGSLFVPDLDNALVPVQEAPARGLEHARRVRCFSIRLSLLSWNFASSWSIGPSSMAAETFRSDQFSPLSRPHWGQRIKVPRTPLWPSPASTSCPS